MAGVVHPRRGVHVQGRLRHRLGRNRHGNPGGLRRAKHLLSTGGRGSGLRNVAARSQILTPFAITAEFSTTTPGQDWTNGNPNVSTFNWGFTLQYSLPYFNTQLAAIDNDFLKQIVPIAEFAFQTPIHNGAAAGALTTGYFQPGVIYEADKWQIALEAMVPMTGATGQRVGVIGSLDFYLDDIPNRIDEPIFPHGLGIAPGI